MDLENVPDIKISEKKHREFQKIIMESYEESKRSTKEWVARMKKKGYSDCQIDMMI